jgi:signal transduction histidine kinase
MSPAPEEVRETPGSPASATACSAHAGVVTAAAAGVATAGAVVLALIPAAQFAYVAPALDVMIETTGVLVGLLVACLVAGRFRLSRRLDDFILACGLGALVVSGLLFHVLAALRRESADGPLWGPGTGQLLGAVLLAGAAFAPATRVRHAPRASLMLVIGSGLLLAAVGLALLAEHLHVREVSVHRVLGAHVSDQPFVSASAHLSTALLGAAAVGFARRARRTNDELFCWFSIGCVLASAAALYGLLFSGQYARTIGPDDLASVLAQLALLVGAAREIHRYWEGFVAAAVLEERHRIARELHDGVAQELAFILRRAKTAGSVVDRDIAAAVERAMADARRAIAALTRPVDAPLDSALLETVETVGNRLGQKVLVDLEPNVRVDPMTREQLVRIASEAVSNAARHGRASTVWLELSNAGRVTMRIVDDGVGFEPSAIDRRKQFGIVGMAERARTLNADFHLTSVPGRGTEIEVTLP